MRTNRNQEGEYIHYRCRTVAIEVCLLLSFAVVFIFNVFPPSKAQPLGDVRPHE
jgi:hypothetical protein